MADRWRAQAGPFPGSLSCDISKDCDVLTTEDCSGSDEEDEVKKEDEMPPEFSSYWRAAVQKPNDFTAWTKLVAYAENEKNLTACRQAYDAFLTCFPLSHIYWKKYTDIEQHLGSAEESEKIFTRAVTSNPLNVTLWTSYILFLLKKLDLNLLESAKKLQSVFSDAINACGMEFRSDELWTLYIEYEIKHGNFKEAMALYNRVLNIPTQQYDMHFERFEKFVSSRSPIEFLTTEELNGIQATIQSENENDQIAAEDIIVDYIEDSLTETDLQKIQQHILDTRKQMHLLNEVQVKKRSAFEAGIKRLYFFASPLNVKQLQNWRKYLEFEMSEGQHERIIFLFERCLMPCAMYEDCWLSYARYMEEHSVEAARSIFQRACRIYLPLKFTIHLQWALFEEKHGQLDSARDIYCNLENVVPEVVMVRLRRVNFERRNGNLQEAERLLRESVQKSSASETTAFYVAKLARFLLKLKKEPEKARDVLIEALKKEPDSPYLHQCLLDTEVTRDAVDDVMHCVEKALNSKIHDTGKVMLAQRCFEYLEDCGNSIKSLLNAFDEHQALVNNQEELKRKAVNKVKGYASDKIAKTQSDNPSVEEDISIPGEDPSAVPSFALQMSKQFVPAKDMPSTQTSTVTVPTKPVQAQPTIVKNLVPLPRPLIRPYSRPPRPAFVRAFIYRPPPPRMPPPAQQFMPPPPPMPPYHMRGPPGPIPSYSYRPWFQNRGGYNGPPPWNNDNFYPPY